MTRAKISLDHGTVTLTAQDPWTGEEFTRKFYVIRYGQYGGYVREVDRYSLDPHGPQVCVGLKRRGNTLIAKSDDDLLDVVRREWKRSCAEARQ